MIHSKFNIFINPKNISINDRAFNYGDGLFETILVKNSKIYYLKEHIQRLHLGCDRLRFVKPNISLVRDSIKKSIGNTKDCVIKIVLSRGTSLYGYKFPKNIKHNLYLIKSKKNYISENDLIKLKYSKYNIYENPYLAKIKHLSRIDQCLVAYNYNGVKNINDLIVLDHQNIIETMSSNIFFVQRKKTEFIFFTPKLEKFGIEGIVKNKIIEFLKKRHYKVIEKNISITSLKKYEISFKVNSIQGLIFIDEIENNKFSRDQIIYNVLKKFIY